MTTKRLFSGILHRATHRLPGVPAHTDQPAGHQGPPAQPSTHHRPHHAPPRPPRFLPAWQRRVAVLFGQEA